MSESKDTPCVALVRTMIGQKVSCTMQNVKGAIEGELAYFDDDDIVLVCRSNYLINNDNPTFYTHILARDMITSFSANVDKNTLNKFLGFGGDKKKEAALVAPPKEEKKEEKEIKVEGAGPLPAK